MARPADADQSTAAARPVADDAADEPSQDLRASGERIGREWARRVWPRGRWPGGRLLRGGMVALAVVVALLVTDLILTGLVERRIAARIGTQLGIPVTVAAEGWPVTVRAATGVLPQVTVRSTDSAPAPAAGPAGEGLAAAAVRSLTLDLQDVDLDLDWGALLTGGEELALTAPQATARVELRPGAAPFGGEVLVVRLREVAADFDEAASRVTAAELTAHTRTAAGDTLAEAALDGVGLDVRHAAPSTAAPGSADRATRPAARFDALTVTADRGEIDVRRDAGAGALPLDVGRLALTLSGARLGLDGAERTFTADLLKVHATDVPLPDTEVTLARLDATLPAARIVPAAEVVRIDADGGRFATTIDEEAANALWPYPGRIGFGDGTASLSLGPVGIDVEVEAAGGAVALQPIVPAALDTFVDVGAITITPPLPSGATVTDVTVRPGALDLAGTGDRLTLPR